MSLAYRPLKKLTGHYGAIYKLLDTKHDYFISCGGDGFIVKWWKSPDREDGILLAKAESPIYTAMINEENSFLIGGCLDGSILLLDLHQNDLVKHIKAHQKSVYGVIATDSYIFTCGGDGVVVVFDNDLSIKIKIQVSNQALRSLKWHEESQSIFIPASDHHIYQLNLLTFEISQAISAHDASVFSLLLKDNVLYSGGRDAKLKSWQLPNFSLTNNVDAHLFTINDIIEFNGMLLTASRDKSIRLWDENLKLIQSLNAVNGGHINSVNTLISLYGTPHFASGSDDKSIIIWMLDP